MEVAVLELCEEEWSAVGGGGRLRRFLLCAALAVISAACFPGSSRGAVTIGSDLAHAPNTAVFCSPSVTWALTALPMHTAASPINGVIVRWRIRGSGSSGSTIALR